MRTKQPTKESKKTNDNVDNSWVKIGRVIVIIELYHLSMTSTQTSAQTTQHCTTDQHCLTHSLCAPSISAMYSQLRHHLVDCK